MSKSEPPIWGQQKGVTPICSDLFRFARFLPICSDLRSLFSGMPRFLPICSDLLRFLPICSDLFSEQIRETPFCRPLLQIPRQNLFKTSASQDSQPNPTAIELSTANQRNSRRLELSISKNIPRGRSAQGLVQCGPNVSD